MQQTYQRKQNTNGKHLPACVFRETAANRCDVLELELENAAAWYKWGPKTDDRIRAMHGGFDTGALYLNTILPEQGRFRILATK
jgi:hypothetical protein